MAILKSFFLLIFGNLFEKQIAKKQRLTTGLYQYHLQIILPITKFGITIPLEHTKDFRRTFKCLSPTTIGLCDPARINEPSI
jgi:hypothetical protein